MPTFNQTTRNKYLLSNKQLGHLWAFTSICSGQEKPHVQAMAETHRSFNISFKFHAVELAETMSKSRATKEFNVDVRRVREWCNWKVSLPFFKKYHKTREIQWDRCPTIWLFFHYCCSVLVTLVTISSFQMKYFFNYWSPNNLEYMVLSQNAVLFKDCLIALKLFGLSVWDQNMVHLLC